MDLVRTSVHYRVGFFGLALMAVFVLVAAYYLTIATLVAIVLVSAWRGGKFVVRKYRARRVLAR